MDKAVTVRQVFEKAFGPIPPGATCHIGFSIPYEGTFIEPSYYFECSHHRSFCGVWEHMVDEVIGPDISDRDGAGFLGFFGDEYDKAYWELVNG